MAIALNKTSKRQRAESRRVSSGCTHVLRILSNTPVSLIKPTDFVGTIRALLVRRAQQRNGSFCQLLPPFLRLPETSTAEWSVSEFKWAEPVGTTKHIESFLAFRNERLARLINASDAKLVG